MQQHCQKLSDKMKQTDNQTLSFNAHFIDSIHHISVQDWCRLSPKTSVFDRYDFFSSLENSQSAVANQGWQPHHLLVSQTNEQSDTPQVDAILPMYLKSHSWGEYVFDWSWAEAYEKSGLNYYPKLVATLPFTPISSDKVFSDTVPYPVIFDLLTQYCHQQNIPSWHILYCPKINTLKKTTEESNTQDVYERNTVQFHWFNHNYKDFDDFIGHFTSRKRKNTRKERLSISQQNLKIRKVLGKDITQQELEFFYLTYQLTYMKRGHSPHLTLEFFKQSLAKMKDNILLIIASDFEEDVACAWFYFDDKQLYGRYWGATKSYNNLHFELCYYQGIDFCIEKQLERFNPGTQGEHKIQRGFEPILTYSYHWIKQTEFKVPVKNFCAQEQQQLRSYLKQCQQYLPFNEHFLQTYGLNADLHD